MEAIIQWGLLFIENIQQVQSPFYLFYFICYTILGLWIGADAPWIFSILNLVGGDE
ncbi:MAG: hypothetical protein ACOC6D_02005 [Atribacterota bacterium]